MRRPRTRPVCPDTLRGAVAGVIAGLVAAAAMEAFQAAYAKVDPDIAGGDDEPATVKAAEALSEATTGEPLPDDHKAPGGELVHYAFGAALGFVYGISSETRDGHGFGAGALFGAGTALIADDVLVPALGLAPPPDQVSARVHAYALASHLVFGVVLEGVRGLLRGR